MMERRKFITGLISLVAAPAIVRAGSLMPVKSYFDPALVFNEWVDIEAGALGSYNFIDMQAMAIRYTGKIIVDMIPRIYND